MYLLFVIAALLLVSFILALISMRDLKLPEEVKKILKKNKIKGAIIFFKEKIVHYSGKK